MMPFLLFLYVVHVAVALHSKPASSLEKTSQQSLVRGYNSYNSYDYSNGNDDAAKMANGYSVLSSQTKALIEQCIIDDYISDELSCGNNPYAGLVRLAFHDCGTSDPTNTSFPGGCNAWSTKKCTEYDACEFTSHENNGLQQWVITLDAMYDNAQLNGQSLSTYMSRADFWHLSAHYAVKKSSAGNVNLTYWGGRVDPDMSWGPRFHGRLPGAFAWSEMQRVARRNNMSDFSASALLGAHTLGQAHPENSGFQGAWDPTPFVFDEQYWKVLLNQQWFEREVQSVNSQTGLPETSLQYSLGPNNTDTSLMLMCDIGQHVNISGGCPVINDPLTPCPNNTNNPKGLSGALTAWANIPSTFYSAFRIAFENMSKWGSSNLVNVTEYTGNVLCGYNSYQHQCNKMYKTTAYWRPGWNYNGGSTTSPPTTTPPTTAPTTTAPYYYSTAGTTSAAPVVATTAASVSTSAPQYYPAPTPSTPAPRVYIEK